MDGTFRYNIASGIWSLHASLGNSPFANKPRAYAGAATRPDPLTHLRPVRTRKNNPFDLENAEMCPPAHVTVQDPDPAFADLPLIRVFDNKFPVLAPESEGSEPIEVKLMGPKGGEVHPSLQAIGLQDVVVQHWRSAPLPCFLMFSLSWRQGV